MMDSWTNKGTGVNGGQRSSTVIPLVGMRSDTHLPELGALTKVKGNLQFPLSADTIQTIGVMNDQKKTSSKRKR